MYRTTLTTPTVTRSRAVSCLRTLIDNYQRVAIREAGRRASCALLVIDLDGHAAEAFCGRLIIATRVQYRSRPESAVLSRVDTKGGRTDGRYQDA